MLLVNPETLTVPRLLVVALPNVAVTMPKLKPALKLGPRLMPGLVKTLVPATVTVPELLVVASPVPVTWSGCPWHHFR